MKKLVYLTFLLAVLTLSSCSLNKMIQMAKDQQLTVNPNPLEVHADSVSFDISATLPVKMLQKGKVYSLNTFYTYGGSEMSLGTVEFKAENYPDAATTQPVATQNFSFPYDESLNRGNIEIQGVALDPKNGKTKSTERFAIASGLITTSTLVEAVYYPAYADHGYNNQEELIPANVNFYFEQGKSNLRYSERRSDRGKYFEAFIAEKNVTRTVTITGTHSPEGPERINSKLSESRAKVIENYYKRMMDKYDYTDAAGEIRFILKPVIEDWTEFKAALADYDGISSEGKSEMLSIVNGPGSFEDKEDRLQKVNGYKKVFKDIYPPLRSAKTEILRVKEKITDAEISVLAKGITKNEVSADTLSIEELMYAASLTPSLEEKEAIYKAAIKKEDSWNAHNNLGAVYIANAMENPSEAANYAQQAETQFDIANNKKASAEAFVNLGSVYLFQGNKAKARESLGKASTMSGNNELTAGMNGVAGSVNIMLAYYDNAVKELSGSEETSVNMFNKGLAYILTKDYQNAVTAFGEATDLDDGNAKAYYGMAVAYARMNNGSKASEMLKKAVDNDASLKERAATDLEFVNFAGSAEFVDALK
ncbi:MAG: tetratricopeptide repeat protein [Bacteroidetes bacterium]|nr:tetratricopeptide repeat protein [Bacteroidota bacterium]